MGLKEIEELTRIRTATEAEATGTRPVSIANATAVAMGSRASTQASVPLGDPSAYTGGIYIWNSDTSLSLFVGRGTITAAAGANKVCLGPGMGYVDPSGDLSVIQVIAASGGPIVNWVGITQ